MSNSRGSDAGCTCILTTTYLASPWNTSDWCICDLFRGPVSWVGHPFYQKVLPELLICVGFSFLLTTGISLWGVYLNNVCLGNITIDKEIDASTLLLQNTRKLDSLWAGLTPTIILVHPYMASIYGPMTQCFVPRLWLMVRAGNQARMSFWSGWVRRWSERFAVLLCIHKWQWMCSLYSFKPLRSIVFNLTL